jgi:hypothetical protein
LMAVHVIKGVKPFPVLKLCNFRIGLGHRNSTCREMYRTVCEMSRGKWRRVSLSWPCTAELIFSCRGRLRGRTLEAIVHARKTAVRPHGAFRAITAALLNIGFARTSRAEQALCLAFGISRTCRAIASHADLEVFPSVFHFRHFHTCFHH